MSANLPARAWLIVALLWVAAVLNYLDRNMILTMRASLKQAIPMTDAQFGLLTSVFLWTYAALGPLGGYLADRFNRSRVIIGSLFIWSAVTWLTAHATTFPQLLVTRVLMGVSEACYIPAALALVVDYHRGPTRSLAVGAFMTGITAGGGLSGVGGWLAERYGWNLAFTLFGCIGVVHSFILLAGLRDAPRDGMEQVVEAKTDLLEALSGLFRNRSFLLLATCWGLLGLAGWALAGWLPTYFGERFQLSQGAAGFSATGYLAVATFPGLLIGGAVSDRWSRVNPRARMLVPVIGMAIAAPGTLLIAHTHVLPLAILGVMLYGFARPFSDANLMPMLCLAADARYRATGYGILNSAACLVGGIGIYAGGALRDANLDASHIFEAAAVGLAIGGILFYLVKPAPTVTAP